MFQGKKEKRRGVARALAFAGGVSLLGLAALASPSFATDPVDLTGKTGIVDPRDLKRYDPPERSLHVKEPPAPSAKNTKSQTHPVEPSHGNHHDAGPEHPKVEVKVPVKPPLVPQPLRP